METEAALLHVLSQSLADDLPIELENVLATSASTSAGKRSKADRVKEWENLPLRSSGEVDTWFRWKTDAAGGETQQQSTRESVESRGSHHQGPGSGYQPEDVLSLEDLPLSPGYSGPAGSAAMPDATTTERAYSGRAKELWESQRNVYF